MTGILFFSTPICYANKEVLPFSIGEKIEYTVSWESIKAGKANFSILPFLTVNGKKRYHFRLELRTSKYVDILFKIRDRLEGFTDIEFTRSLSYKKQQWGKEKRDVTVQFDWDKNTATYSNFNETREPIQIPSKTFDPLSAFYKMRTLNLKTDQILSFAVTDGKKYFMQKGEVGKKEKITIASGTFDTYVLDLHVNHFSGVFKKSENPTVKLWVTDDKKHIPVRIKVKVFLGSVIFDLVSITQSG